jgi:hypothetical protein
MFLFSANSVLATPLLDLLQGGEIIVGDKRFFNFRDFVSTAEGAIPTIANPARIEVDPIIVGDELGLRFSSELFRSSGPAGFLEPTGHQTTEFSYDVEVIGAQSIIGNSLSYVTDIPGIRGITRVTETVSSLAPLAVIADTEVFTEQFDLNFDQLLMDQDTFAPQTQLTIHNLIYLEDAGPIISEFSQTFTQTQAVPEPATLLLLGTGLATAAYRRRWKR